MAKIPRITQLVFASNAGFQERAVIGSLAAGLPVFTSDPSPNVNGMQSLSQYLDGWFATVLGGASPAIEDVNSLFNLITRQLANILQTGVPEWDAATTYYIGSIAQDAFGKLYISITDTNVNNPLSDTLNWKIMPASFIDTLTTGHNWLLGGNVQDQLDGADALFSAKPIITVLTAGAGNFHSSYLFTCASATAVKGDTYTNNGFTFTVQQSVTNSKYLICTATGVPTGSGNLVRTSGAGTDPIVFSLAQLPKYSRQRLSGGGGGGGGGGHSTPGNAGIVGVVTTFGSLTGNGGSPGGGGSTSVGGNGGSAAGTASGGNVQNVTGGSGGGGWGNFSGIATNQDGGQGGSNAFGGGGGGAPGGQSIAGKVGAPNTGGGGGGGCGNGASSVNSGSGGGGQAGGFVENIDFAPVATYAYSVGTGGAGGANGGFAQNGGAGAAGKIIIEEHF